MGKRNCRFIFTILICCTIMMGMQYYLVHASIPSNVHSGYLSGNYVPQEKSNWCWVASAENACIREGYHYHDQYYTVNNMKGTNSDPYPNVSGSIEDSASAVGKISSNNLSYTGEYNAKTFNFIAEMIYNNHPVIAAGGYYDANNNRQGGHAVLVIGWTNAHGTNEISYYDSLNTGSYHTCTFAGFCNGNYNTRIYDQTAYHS